MAITTLSFASALNPGSDLWIVADYENSKWASRLDWYLNFQILKSQRHISEKTSPFLIEVTNKTNLDLPQISTNAQSSLMISSTELLPNRWVLMVPMNGSLEKWVQAAGEAWLSLAKPSLRVFIPTGQNAGKFSEAWLEKFIHDDFTVVLD